MFGAPCSLAMLAGCVIQLQRLRRSTPERLWKLQHRGRRGEASREAAGLGADGETDMQLQQTPLRVLCVFSSKTAVITPCSPTGSAASRHLRTTARDFPYFLQSERWHPALHGPLCYACTRTSSVSIALRSRRSIANSAIDTLGGKLGLS